MAAKLEQELDRLYQLPRGEFTSARDELAKRLRSEGNRERAEEVKKLRKPTAAVWLVNQLSRERELDVQRLVKAGESLTQAHSKAATAASSPAFLEARRDEHHALECLAKAAHEIAAREGVGASAVTKATETLRGAALRAEARDGLRRGRLTEEVEPPGFEALSGLPADAPSPTSTKKKPSESDERTGKRRLQQEARRRVQQLRAQERELASAVRTVEREAEQAEAQASAARARAEEAREAARAAADELEAAESELERS